MTLINEFRGAIAFFVGGSTIEKIECLLVLFIAYLLIIFEIQWLIKLKKKRISYSFEPRLNKANTATNDPIATASLATIIIKPIKESLGKLVLTESKIVFAILSSIHKTKIPTPIDINQLNQPISNNYHSKDSLLITTDKKEVNRLL
jgi:hypothetical protein